MKIMADRDFEIESRLNSDSFVEDLKAEWNAKLKLKSKNLFLNLLSQWYLKKMKKHAI